MPRKANAYRRPCNQRLRQFGPPLARAAFGIEPSQNGADHAAAGLQHAEAALFYAQRGDFDLALASLRCVAISVRSVDKASNRHWAALTGARGAA